MKRLLILPVVVGVLFYLARATIILGPYTYDEPDYMYAASLGWSANAMDSPSLSLAEFVKIGLGRGRDAGAKTELSETIRESGDVVFYRHWHGPLYSAWLRLVGHLTSDEHTAREWNFVFPIAVAVLMYFGALWLLPGTAGQAAAILAAVLYLWSYPVVRSTELAPHQLFAACVTAVLLLIAKMFATLGDVGRNWRRYWYAAVIMTAIAFCVLEVAFALIFTMLICGYLLRGQLKPDLMLAAKSAALFIATVLIIWPGAILKLSFVKAYLFMAYLAIFRREAWGTHVTLAGTWWVRLIDSPVPWILAAIGAVYFMKHRRETRVLIPFAVFTLIMAAAILPVKTEGARYTLPFWPGLVLFAAFSAGLVIAKQKPAASFAALVCISAAMFATSWPSVRSGLPVQNTRCEALLALIRDQGLAHKTLLVPHDDLPMLHYYFYGSHFRSYYDDTLPQQVRKEGIDGIIDRSDPPRWIPR